MDIDWFTFFAQIINFLILVFLLRRFLYGPIMNAMETRQRRIAAEMAEAERLHQEAQEEAASLRAQRQELEQHREGLMKEAEERAGEQHQTLVKQAKQEVDTLRTTWHEALQREKESFLGELQGRVSEQLFTLLRRALNDLADVELEAQIVRVFMVRLARLDDEERAHAARDGGEIAVFTAFDLADEQRSHLSDAIGQHLGASERVRFERSPELISGIMLRGDGYQVGWNLRDYLDEMEERVAVTLAEHATEVAEASLPEPVEE